MNRNRNRENRKNFIWVEDKTFKKDVCFECGKGNCDIDYHSLNHSSKPQSPASPPYNQPA